MLSPKDKVTVTIPEIVNKRIDELSSQLALTKGLLFVVGFALLLKLLDDWMKGDS
jgi:mannose/fructose/N-acetylgalactosamine-specific phosphotransferase system component IIC